MDEEHGDHPTHADTHRYPSGTDGYSSESGGDAGGEEPWWRALGFESLQAYLDKFEADQTELWERWFGRGRRGRDVPAASLPGAEIADVPRARRHSPVRQVGVKLRPADYEALARAAFLYGVRPTTLARLLVNRGVRAVLESHDQRGG